MRSFEDETGARWDVVVGRESWGAMVAIFIPRDPGDAGVRQSPLGASDYEEAVSVLHALEDEELRRLLGESEPKTP